MPQDRDRIDRFLPLKPFVLDVLLALADGKRHGWAWIREVQQREGGDRILPANFYRTLRALREDGLIAEAAGEDPGERRQYFSLTSLGTKVARAEVKMHGLGARNDSWSRLRRTSAYVEYETGRFWMDTWRYDLRHALRMMLRQRGTTAIILLTLALAIGANTAVFSAVHTVLIRPLPYDHPESLVMLWEKREAEGVMNNSVSAADYLDWSRLATSFTAMAAFTEMTADLTGEGDPEKLPVRGVSPPFFQVFGVRPLLGRTFEAGEDAVGRKPIVV